MSKIFTIISILQHGVKMKKNRLKLFKNKPKRPKKSAQLEKNNFPTAKQKFSNWKIIFSQLSFANFPTAFRIENENVNIFLDTWITLG